MHKRSIRRGLFVRRNEARWLMLLYQAFQRRAKRVETTGEGAIVYLFPQSDGNLHSGLPA